MASGTLLSTVADHEEQLMARLEEARAEAGRLIDEAHQDAASQMKAAQTKLDEDLLGRRREAARERDAEQARIRAKSREQVEEIRNKVAGRVDTVRDEVMAKVLPGGTQEGGSQ